MVVFYNMDENEVKNYAHFHLSMEVRERSFSLLLTDKKSNKPVAIEHRKFDTFTEFNTTFAQSEILAKSIPSSSSCVVVNSDFTLVSSAIFLEEEINTYLNLAVAQNPVQAAIALADKHQKNDCVTCFNFPTELNAVLKNKFPGILIKHLSSVLADSLKDGFHVNFSTQSSLEIAVIKEDKLLFLNRFAFENKDETLYYLSLVAEKFSLSIQEINISLSGIVDKNGDMFSFWKQFIPQENITFNEIEASQLNAVSTHQYFTLHKQFQCV